MWLVRVSENSFQEELQKCDKCWAVIVQVIGLVFATFVLPEIRL